MQQGFLCFWWEREGRTSNFVTFKIVETRIGEWVLYLHTRPPPGVAFLMPISFSFGHVIYYFYGMHTKKVGEGWERMLRQ